MEIGMIRRDGRWSTALVLGFAGFMALHPSISNAQAVREATLSKPEAEAVDAAMTAEMKKEEVVGLALGVIRDGKVVYAKGYGWADRERRVPVTTKTLFNWASCSKPLAGVVAMQLVEAHKLDLDADVRALVPEFPDKGVKITIRQLLDHQSGIPHYANGKIVPTVRTYPTADPFLDPVLALDKFNRSDLLFKPGEKSSYSSYAYVLLSAALQRAGKQPFDEQVRERIAAPLGMKSLRLDLPGAAPSPRVVRYTKTGGKVVRAPEEFHYWKQGAGGYESNVEDFARWADGLIDHRLVSKASERAMWQDQKTTDGKPTSHGLGFGVETSNGRLKVSHNGSQTGVATRMVLYPDERHGMVVLANCDHAEPGKFTTAAYTALSRKSR